MAGLCCEILGESESAVSAEPTSRAFRRRRMDLRPFKLVADSAVQTPLENGRKRQKIDLLNSDTKKQKKIEELNESTLNSNRTVKSEAVEKEENKSPPKFGMTSVCGRRRDMEDAVSIQISSDIHFYGVFDGHGCSHIAMKCRDRFHEIVKEEIESGGGEKAVEWKRTMERSFERMDKEVKESTAVDGKETSNCRCELQTPQCDAVGSTAVVAVVTPDKIIVANCGDSRAVLGRNGVALPLSDDHKPDRPDELMRIQEAGGRVIYWDGARVLGVLAMSRAIGDNYLKPYVISEPEVTITERNGEEECLILASDGLWDVVTNDTACGVARMCLSAQRPSSPLKAPISEAVVKGGATENSDKGCGDASILLTKLALARHSSDNVSVVVVDLKKNQPI